HPGPLKKTQVSPKGLEQERKKRMKDNERRGGGRSSDWDERNRDSCYSHARSIPHIFEITSSHFHYRYSSSRPPRPKSYVRVRRSKHSGRTKFEHVRPRPRDSWPSDSDAAEWSPRESRPSSRHRDSYAPQWPRESRPCSRLPPDVQRPAYGVTRPAQVAVPGVYGGRIPSSAIPGAAYSGRAPLGGKPGWEVIEPRDLETGRPVVVDLRGR
ncbi:MAG: hypothetical protein L6R36_008023, partial [Xanthoria steineri]